MGVQIGVKSEKTEKGDPKINEKNDAKFGGVQIPDKYLNQSPLDHQRGDFGAGGEVRRGQAPPGPAISALIPLFSLKRPAPGGVRRKTTKKQCQKSIEN